MTNRSALALAFATGYAVGRSKIRLPLGVGGALLVRRLGLKPGQLGEQFKEKTPQLAEVTGRLRNNVREVGRAAGGVLPTERLESLTGGVRGQLGRVPWKNGDAGGADEPDGTDETGGKGTGGSSGSASRKRTESSDGSGGKSTGTRGSRASGKSGGTAARRAPAKKAAARGAAKKTASAPRKSAETAKKSAGTAKKSAGSGGKTTGAAKRTGGSGRG
jgi:hypothetical protein